MDVMLSGSASVSTTGSGAVERWSAGHAFPPKVITSSGFNTRFPFEEVSIRGAIGGNSETVDAILHDVAKIEVSVELPRFDVLVPAIRERNKIMTGERLEKTLREVSVSPGQPALGKLAVDADLIAS